MAQKAKKVACNGCKRKFASLADVRQHQLGSVHTLTPKYRRPAKQGVYS